MCTRHVNRYAGPHEALVHAHCLYRFDEPVSPHLAAGMAAAEEKAGAWVSDQTRTWYHPVVDTLNTLWLSSFFFSFPRTSSYPPTMRS